MSRLRVLLSPLNRFQQVWLDPAFVDHDSGQQRVLFKHEERQHMDTATVAHWDEGITARGTLILLPGRGERPSVYDRLARRLAADGYRVRAVGDASAGVSGVSAQVENLLAERAPGPAVLVGSDTGALMALRLVARRVVATDALVLAGLPDTRHPADAPATWDDELDARTSCGAHRDWISTARRLERGALHAGRVPEQLDEELDPSAVTVPVLGLHGVDDAVSALARVRAEFARFPTAKLISVSGTRHDVLNDVTHRSVAATIVLFLESLREEADAREITRVEDLGIERGIHRARTSQAAGRRPPPRRGESPRTEATEPTLVGAGRANHGSASANTSDHSGPPSSS